MTLKGVVLKGRRRDEETAPDALHAPRGVRAGAAGTGARGVTSTVDGIGGASLGDADAGASAFLCAVATGTLFELVAPALREDEADG